MERAIINRERASNSYRVLAYYPGKVISEWPFRAFPVALFVCIAYWPVNFQKDAGKFFQFLLVALLEFTAMTACGLTVGWVVHGFGASGGGEIYAFPLPR